LAFLGYSAKFYILYTEEIMTAYGIGYLVAIGRVRKNLTEIELTINGKLIDQHIDMGLSEYLNRTADELADLNSGLISENVGGDYGL